MIPFKELIAKQLIGKHIHFKCNCIIPLDCIGIIRDFEINKNKEIIFIIEVNKKFIKIGENHPNLNIEEIKEP